jgi:heat shock protein HslJ
MACLEPEGIMEQEQFFLQFLADDHRFELAEGQLQIVRSGGGALMFVPRQ